jgi:crotonobetainyl-CoA:carnitine CoA-transferase CaiB-like acyl-CoA transferase
VGIHAGPLFGALGVLSGVTRARATGEPCRLEIAQSDAAAAMDWLRSETWKAYERPESEVTGNKADDYERRAPGTAGMRDGVRYQFYETADGHILFMASEREFWENFCDAIDRPDLFERHPGSQYADHARGNAELRSELGEIFRGRTTGAWLELGNRANTPIAPVNTPKTLADDPQFQDRLPWIPQHRVGTAQVPSPIKVVGEAHPHPEHAPDAGQHTDVILREVLGYTDDRIMTLRGAGALG